MNNAFLVDKDILTILRISARTLRSVMKDGPNPSCAIDLRKANPIRVGSGKFRCQRRWSVGKFAEVCGLTREEIWAALA